MRSILLLSLSLSVQATAQPFPIGTSNVTLFDPARNRDIATDLYYPGVAAGNNVAVAAGSFPVLVIGHGFVMNTNAYANLWNYFVPKGYIVALPETEGGFSPDHGAFGVDLAFVAQAILAANADGASPFFGRVAPTAALMGHSMGGGASLLGAAGNTAITTVVDFAPAETNPSAIAAAADIVVPTLIFAGSNDCITPIADHTAPMFAALTVPCRAFVNVTGGGHCFFAENNFNCAFGELTCSPSPDISRAEQHDVVNDFAGLWLDHFLKGDASALNAVVDSMDLSTRVTASHTCAITTATDELNAATWWVGPQPASDQLVLHGVGASGELHLLDLSGRTVLQARKVVPGEVIDVRGLASGTYRLAIRNMERVELFTVVIMH